MESEIFRQRLADALNLAKQGAYPEARTALENLCVEAPDSPESHYYLGLACKRTQDIEGARTAWERCLALDPFHHQARTQLGLLSAPPGTEFLTDSGASSSPLQPSSGVPRVQPAPLGARSLGFLMDSILFNFATVPFVALFILFFLGNSEIEGDPLEWFLENGDPIQWGTTMVSFVVHLVFIPFFYYESGMTPGKRLLGIRIVDVSTLEPLSAVQSLGRFLASFLSSCVLYFGYLFAFFNRDRRTLHDYLAGTFVASSESVPMTLPEKGMTGLLVFFAVIGLGMSALGLFFAMGGLLEMLDQYPISPF